MLAPNALHRVLTLDGEGAKGFHTFGVLDEVEKQDTRWVCGTGEGGVIVERTSAGP